MKKYIIFIIVLTIMTINTVKGETPTSFVEAWSVNEQIAYNEENYEYAMMLSHKSIAYKDGFIVSSVNFEKFESTKEGETTILIYNEKGKVTKETTIKDATVLEFATINDYIYALQYYMDDSFKIAKYDENLNKMDEIETDYNLGFTYITTMYNIKTFASYENKLYIITSEGDAATEYDENLKEIRTISAYTEEEMLCKIGREYCYYVNGDGNTEDDFDFFGYDSKNNLEIHTGSFNDGQSALKIIKDNEEKAIVGINRDIGLISPRIMKNVIVLMQIDSEYNYQLQIVDLNGNLIQQITKKNSGFINLSANENTNTFMVTNIGAKENCNETSSSCMVIKNTVYKEGVKIELKGDNLIGNSVLEFTNFIETSDGNYIAVGSNSSTDIEGLTNKGEEDAIIVKYDKNSKIVWKKNYGGSSNDYFTQLVSTNDGGVIAVGYSQSSDVEGITNKGEEDAIIVKYDKDGNIEWQKSWGGNSSDFFKGIAKVGNNYVVVGSTRSTDIEGINYENTESTIGDLGTGIVIQYDANGNVIKQNGYDFDGDTCFYNIKRTSDGGYIIGGEAQIKEMDSGLYSGSALLIKYDENNIEKWKYIGEKFVSGRSNFKQIEELKDGSIIVIEDIIAGDGDGQGNLIILDSAGAVINTIEGKNYYINEFQNITATPDGGIIIVMIELKYLVTDDSFPLGMVETNKAIKITSDGEYKNLYTTEITMEYANLNVEGTFVSKVIETEDGEYVAIGVTASMKDGTARGGALLSKISFDYIVEQEETTNGTYEVTKEDDKGVITLSPEKGYTLDTLTITNAKGEQVEYYEKNGKYYFDLTDAVTVNVTYKEEVINPNTITFLKLGFLAIIIFAIYNLFISKKIKIKKFV